MQDLRRSFNFGDRPSMPLVTVGEKKMLAKKQAPQYMLEKFKHINVDYTQSTGKELVFIDLQTGKYL